MSEMFPLYGFTVVAHVQVDAEDVEKLSPYRWNVHRRIAGQATYASARVDGKRTLMHRFLLDVHGTPGMEVDHINGDTLDNRRANLRLVTRAQNAQNRRATGTSKYRGVSLNPLVGRWKASARLDGLLIHLGYYADELEAAKVAARFRAQHMTHSVEDPALLEDVAA